MKKILLLLASLGAALCVSSCGSDDNEGNSGEYVTVSGNWEIHLTASDGVSDSVVRHPNRLLRMTWSDVTLDSTRNLTVVNSQIAIGNGAWRFKSYINGNVPGTYNIIDSISLASYTFTTKPGSNDSLTVIDYNLSGTLTWAVPEVGMSNDYAPMTISAKAVNENGAVNFNGKMESAKLAK